MMASKSTLFEDDRTLPEGLLPVQHFVSRQRGESATTRSPGISHSAKSAWILAISRTRLFQRPLLFRPFGSNFGLDRHQRHQGMSLRPTPDWFPRIAIQQRY